LPAAVSNPDVDMQPETISVRVHVSDEGTLVARIAGCADVLEAEDIVALREKVERLIRATYGESRRVALIV
jgi:hypothetical protein